MNLNQMTRYLVSVASCIDRYCKYLNKNPNDYSKILGHVYRLYQDQISKLSPQGVALVILNLKDINEDDYGKYIEAFKNKADRIIKRTNSIEEQFEKMKEIKEKVEKE